MFDFSKQIESFRDEKVRLSSTLLSKLLAHRKSNRDRLIDRLPKAIKGLSIGASSFKPQGSVVLKTTIQTKFTYEEYDIDDGIVLWKHQLVDEDGYALTHTEVREIVREALKDRRFAKQPVFCSNCIRVFYAETDAERHHVDFPVYRKWLDENGRLVRELASEDGWVESEPTQVTNWMLEAVEEKNAACDGWGTQMRHLNQLVKRFCRSRNNWDLPNGMKLMMLIHECLPHYCDRIDVAFRELLKKLKARLENDKVILNLAHPEKPAITRSNEDENVSALYDRIVEALEQLEVLDSTDEFDTAVKAWDWLFKGDGFFEGLALEEKANAILSNTARTSACGVIGSIGIPNKPHRFFGD